VIVVDSSVWINNLRDNETPGVARLRAAIIGEESILLGDLVLLEILQGARDDLHAARIERDLRCFPVVNMLDKQIATSAAHNFRRLRSLGITLRSAADLTIETYCLRHGHMLLHEDRGFAPMIQHLGLQSLS
jgi:predicted nucleic acid-binding protein